MATPTIKGRILALVIGMVLTIPVAEIVSRVAMPHWREYASGWFMRSILVPGYGTVYTGKPGFDGNFAQNNGDFRVRIAINEFGLRNPEPVAQADGRAWFVGDSMTFGWGVEGDEMFSSAVAERSGRPTYNVASPGTDVCGYQALVARMPADLKPSAVVVGLVLENDIANYDCRARGERQEQAWKVQQNDDKSQFGSLLAFKLALTRRSALYNLLAVGVKRVNLIEALLESVGLVKEPHTYRRVHEEDSVNTVLQRTADELVALRGMLPRGIPFAVLVIPARFELRDDDVYYRRLRQEMGNRLRQADIAVIDPYKGFREAGFRAAHFVHDGHWSPLGHRIAANAVAAWLEGLKAAGNMNRSLAP